MFSKEELTERCVPTINKKKTALEETICPGALTLTLYFSMVYVCEKNNNVTISKP